MLICKNLVRNIICISPSHSRVFISYLIEVEPIFIVLKNANFSLLFCENCAEQLANLKGSDHAVHEELVAGHLGVVKGEEW